MAEEKQRRKGSKDKKEDLLEVHNWYEKMPSKYHLKCHNPNFKTHNIKVPFRMCIIGNSGSMKTNTLLNLLHTMTGTFESIFYITKNKDEPLLNFLEDKLGNKGLKITEGLASVPDLDKIDKESNTLIILDDLVNEPKKEQKIISDYYIRCRKRNCSIVYISQSFYDIPKMIRNNINYLIIKQVSSMKNLTMITRECSLGITKEALTTMYKEATKDKKNFMLIDLEEGDPLKRFRFNLDCYFELTEDDFK
jgi:hypothetical protein